LPTAREPLSVAIITLNAGSALEACLASVRFADEIVLVDSGSTDDTLAIARTHGARVLSQTWLGYGPQKQYAVEAAGHHWVLCIDADERISDALRESIETALRAPRASAFEMARCNRFMGRWLRHGEGYPDWSLRLFDRRHGRWSDDPVHEKVVADGPVARLEGDLMHESAETMAAYLAKQDRYTSLQAERLVGEPRLANLARMIASPLVRFIKFYFLRLGFLDGWPGLVHILIGCRNSFWKYAKGVMAARQGINH
jgi:glycosyltransferase involved in cell wall biosynthesis